MKRAALGVAVCLVSTMGASSAIGQDAGTDAGTGPNKRVFVTSIAYGANLGGVQGATDKCNERASKAGLSGTYRAWISSSVAGQDPITLMTHATGNYVLVDGTIVALGGWKGLGKLQHPIDMTETKGKPPATPDLTSHMTMGGTAVWSTTNPTGTRSVTSPTNVCNDWTSTAVGFAGYGSTAATNSWWSMAGSYGSACKLTAALYCFEQ
jgi:hypothetical protein